MSRITRASPGLERAVDLAIIGGGAAGMVAALAAHERGLETVIFERDGVPSGSTALSAGLIPAAGTRWQRASGIDDDPRRFAADINAKARGTAEAGLVRIVTQAIGPCLEWLADRHGLEFSVIENFRYPGHSAARMHGLPSRSGRELVDRLRAATERAGVTMVTRAHVHELLVDANDALCGLGYSRPDGSTDTIGAGAILLACNGYGGNPALVAQHVPALAGALYFGHPGNQGDALLWGMALGAATRDLSGHQGHGSVAHPHGILITWATITEGGFQVNRACQRFHNEAEGYSEAAARVIAEPDGVAFTLFDARIAGIARQFEDFRAAEAQGAILMADDVTSLAALMRVDADALAATFRDVATLKSAGATDKFGRSFAGLAPLEPPFAAVRVEGALFHTQGGLLVDGSARVLRPDGSAIPGLLAAGGAACGVSGPDARGYLSGNGLLTAMALGRIAGGSMPLT